MKPVNSWLLSKQAISPTEIQPDDLAAQLTLIDLPIFKSITRDELTKNSGLSSKQSHQCSCPNLQAWKRQFNQLTFWVANQILALDSARQRAELVSYFTRTAKCLYELNNLHSSNAIISALLSSPIYRLDRTWYYLNKKYPKDRVQFEKLQKLFSDTNNYEALRKHLNNCSLPCIPYLGMYSRDIIYIQQAHHEHESQRIKSTNKVLDLIQRFQSSYYDNLYPSANIQHILLSKRYLDELQMFIEDANYRRSLEIEPPIKRTLHVSQ